MSLSTALCSHQNSLRPIACLKQTAQWGHPEELCQPQPRTALGEPLRLAAPTVLLADPLESLPAPLPSVKAKIITAKLVSPVCQVVLKRRCVGCWLQCAGYLLRRVSEVLHLSQGNTTSTSKVPPPHTHSAHRGPAAVTSPGSAEFKWLLSPERQNIAPDPHQSISLLLSAEC